MHSQFVFTCVALGTGAGAGPRSGESVNALWGCAPKGCAALVGPTFFTLLLLLGSWRRKQVRMLFYYL